jgi:hypothetical protein
MAFISRRRVLQHDGSLRRCKATAVCSPLLGAGDETSGDDEALIVPLTMDHVASHVPSRRPPPPLWTEFKSGVPDENMRRAGWKNTWETTERDFYANILK